jgi:ABC-type iron transport system FetAB permease component
MLQLSLEEGVRLFKVGFLASLMFDLDNNLEDILCVCVFMFCALSWRWMLLAIGLHFLFGFCYMRNLVLLLLRFNMINMVPREMM